MALDKVKNGENLSKASHLTRVNKTKKKFHQKHHP